MPEPIELAVNGRRYGGWQELRVRRSMQQLANSFELTVTERWPGTDKRRPIQPGAEAELTLGGERVIRGYVDDVNPSYDSESHSVTVAGRDRSGDLVDCTAENVQAKGKRLDEHAQRLTQPFGVGVHVAPGVDVGPPFRTWKPDEFSTVYDVLEQAARFRGVLMIADGNGDIVITETSDERANTELVLGDNVLSAEGQFSERDLFSRYTVVSQTGGGDKWFGSDAAQIKGEASDESVERHRPSRAEADQPSSPAECRERAKWKRNVRHGRARQVTYTVAGWRDGADLWRPNRRVRIRDSWMGLDTAWQIADVEFVLDDQGARTRLTVMPPSTFDKRQIPEPDDSGGSGWMQ
jgi:prophage tail gpP-like protein